MKYIDGHKEIKYPDGREESIYGEVKETHQEEQDEIIEDVQMQFLISILYLL